MIKNDWFELLYYEFQKEYFVNMWSNLQIEYNNYEVFPKKDDIFNAFNTTSFENTKVVILGQDPYHDINQAHGLSFSVQDGVKIPASLRNIFKEIEREYNIKMPTSCGNLTKWAEQGVLLLNATLTVRAHDANSHKKIGWTTFTNEVMKILNEKEEPIVFIFWGNNAKAKRKFIRNPKHLILEAPHPSPLGAYRGFFDCNHFKLCNEFLVKNNIVPIDWKL